MGCASSTPMIQTTGSEMLKAATHVASDATKNAEDAVQGVKDTVGKTLETAKDSVATTMEGVKHEVENVVKEKTEMLEDAKNSLMEKLHLAETTKNDIKEELNDKTETATDMASELSENLKAVETDDVQTTKHESDSTMMANSKEMGHHVLTRNSTETDSLKTTTPEPEIEQALANSKHGDNEGGDRDDDDDDEDNNPPTPKPTLSELENLKAEILQQQLSNIAAPTAPVNDITMNNNNTDDLLMITKHDIIKSTTDDINNLASAAVDTMTTSTTNDNLHIHKLHKNSTPPLLSLPLATTAIATATSQHRKDKKEQQILKITQETQQPLVPLLPLTPQQPQPALPPPPPAKSKTKSKAIKREEKLLNGNKPTIKNHKKSDTQNEEKRPGTTEWEKFADMLAQHRKYNPHDAFRRGGTLTKFGTNGAMPLRERPSYVGHHMRGNGDDDSSDTTSNWRGSPHNSQRSSARAGGRIQRLPNRPNTGNQRKNHHEFSALNNGGAGGVGGQKHVARRNSNVVGNGRKFDYNPTRSRLNDYVSTVSSLPYPIETSLQPAFNNNNTQLPYAPYESVKSPSKMRSHHSRHPHLEPIERSTIRSQQQRQTHQQHFNHDYSPNNNNGSSMPLQSATNLYHYSETTLTRESSNTSLFSNGSYVENLRTFKSTMDLRPLSTNPPIRNTSSFLTTPRCSPFSVRKSYTDLYFSSTSNKENNKKFTTDLSSVSVQRSNLRDKSPYKVRDRCEVCCKKYVIK